MHTYIVKNIDDYPIVLEFTDGSSKKIRPHSLCIWQGPEENLDFLQDYVDAGKLDVWTFEVDFAARQMERKPLINFEWLKEGF